MSKCKICNDTGETTDSTDMGDHLWTFTVPCDCVEEKSKVQKITPDPNCGYCQGEGMVYDTVDYGSTTAQLSSFCDCVEAQADEDVDEIVLEPYEPDPPYDHTGHDTLEEKYL